MLYPPREKCYRTLTDFIVSNNGHIAHHHVQMPHNMNQYQEWYEVALEGQTEESDR